MRSNSTKVLVRNVAHLGIGQVATTAIGILLTSVIGRALEPAELGILYIVIAANSFIFVIVDWGQSTYLVREMARGRIDEPQLIGSALLIRLTMTAACSAVAMTIALGLGYSGHIIALTLLAVLATIPMTVFAPFDCSFRGKDRMDLDAFANIAGKAATLLSTAAVLHFGGGLEEVILMLGVGNISTLLVGALAARRLGIGVKPPAMQQLRELLKHGAPIAALSLVIALQPFLEILLLSAFAGATVVGWYGAFRNIYGVVVSPAFILLGASFPELSRASLSVPDLRITIDKTGRFLFIAAALTSSALYVFANSIVAIIYGHGRFQQTASILQISAIFIPLLFFTCLLGAVVSTIGRNQALAVLNIARITLYVMLSWLFIGYWPQPHWDKAITLVIIAGLVELPTMIAYWALLPRGAISSITTLNVARAYTASIGTVALLSMLQPLEIWFLAPLYMLFFSAIAVVTRLVLPSDLRLAIMAARSKVPLPEATSSAPDR